MSVVAGVDGGGTRTRAVLLDERGTELGRSDIPGAVATAHEPGRAADAVTAAVERAAREAGVTGPVGVLWAGLAGAGGREARDAVTAAIEARGRAERVHVGTDVEAAFQHGFGSGPGLLLIVGTGSIAWARTDAGVVHRVGGWGSELGDEGSGFAIGLDGLRCVVRAEDGREPPTSLRSVLLGAVGLETPEALVAWIGRRSKAEVAALAPLVVAEADAGDGGAASVVDRAVGELRLHVEAALGALARMGDAPRHEVVLWGGLVAGDGPLRGRVVRALGEIDVDVLDREIDPPLGAARLALAMLGPGHP